MMTVMVIGAAWLGVAGLLLLVLARAIRDADRRDEESARTVAAARRVRRPPPSQRGIPSVAELEELYHARDDGEPGAGSGRTA